MKNYVDKDKLQEYTTKLVGKLETKFSSPLTAATVAEMTDETKVYVYTGSETGYTAGNWYYYDGEDWVSGGVYNAVAVNTDKTLLVADKAADGKAAGDAIRSVQSGLTTEIARAEAEEARIEALFTQPVEEAVDNWLNEHPEATTTVQDLSLTEVKFTEALTLKTLKDYAIPEMYGAVGDGTTDDTVAVQAALNASTCTLLLNKTYYITQPLSIPAYHTLAGLSDNSSILKFATNINGLELEGRGINVKNVRITTTSGSTGTGIVLPNVNADNHWIKIENAFVYYFYTGILGETSTTWDCTFKYIRIAFAECAVKLQGGFSIEFNNLYVDRCSRALAFTSSVKAHFINCNFGINDINNYYINTGSGSNCMLVFESCNFECDSAITTGTSIFYLTGYTKFLSCRFLLSITNANTYVFVGGATTYSTIFENCAYVQKSGDTYSGTNFYDRGHQLGEKQTVNKLKISGSNIPRPNYYTNSIMIWTDYDNIGIPQIASTQLTNVASNIIAGQMLYLYDLKKMAYYDGTNFIYPSVAFADITANRPTSNITAGYMMFDTTLGKPIWYNGTDWVDATGATV